MRALLLVLVALLVACGGPPSPTLSPSPEGEPTVVIESPENGSPAPVGQPLLVQARAHDAVGVGQIDLRVGGVTVDSVAPIGDEPFQEFAAELEWTPSADGVVTLEAIAYRIDGTASAPANVLVAVIIAGETGPPSVSPSPTTSAPTPTPGVTPTAAARPSLPPFATPTPSPSPSPTPTPTPIPLDMAISLSDLEIPPLDEAIEATLTAYVLNKGPGPAPPMTIRARLCAPSGSCGPGGTGEASTSPLNPGEMLDYEVKITPLLTGERVLRVRIILPDGYEDPVTDDNVWEFPVTVNPAP